MRKLIPLIFALCSNYAHAQIFSQNFNSSTNKRTYIGSGTNQFDWITDFRNSKSSIETENGNNFLRFNKIGSSSIIISKNTPLSGNNNLAYIQFKFRVTAPDVAETPSNQLATLYLGKGDTDAFEPDNTGGVPDGYLFNAINIRLNKEESGDYKFYISSVPQNTYSGWQTITCVANRTGAPITFTAPNGKSFTLQNDKQAIWVGDVIQVGSGTLKGAQTSFNKFKLRFVPDYANAKLDIDDLMISNTIPTK